MILLERNVELKRTTVNFDTDDELCAIKNTSDKIIIAIGGKPKELPIDMRLRYAGVFNLDELNENVWGTLPENICIIGTSHSAASVLMKMLEDGVCPGVKNIYIVGREGWKFLEDDPEEGIKGPSGDFIRKIGLKDKKDIVVNGKNIFSCDENSTRYSPENCIAINTTGIRSFLSRSVRVALGELVGQNRVFYGLVNEPTQINLMGFAEEYFHEQ